MLDSLLEGEIEDLDLLECFFLESLYCSLGSSLLEDGRIKFDECIKRLSSMPTADTEGSWARPGELPGRKILIPSLVQASRGGGLAFPCSCLCHVASGMLRASKVSPAPAGQPLSHTAGGGCASGSI